MPDPQEPASPGGTPGGAGQSAPYPVGDIDPETRRALLEAVAARICRMGMAVPAIFYLESSKPLSYVGSQIMVFFGPFVQSLFPINRYYEFAALMEDRQNVERLLQAIERIEDERQHREREEKDRRENERRRQKEERRQRNGSRCRWGWRRRGLVILMVWGASLGGPAPRGAQAAREAPATTPPPTPAVAPAPATNLRAMDTPNDSGHSITLSWDRSADDGAGAATVKEYRIYRATSPAGPFELVGHIQAGARDRRKTYVDATAENGVGYTYRVGSSDGARESVTDTALPVRASGQWFNRNRTNMLVAVLLLSGVILLYIRRAQSGAKVYLRPVAGLQAFEDGVGRATEMGRQVLFIPGIHDLDSVETVAGVIILGHVAKMTATYGTPLEVPVSRSLVMATAREITRQAYTVAGRPDLYDDEMVHYITDEQFAYAAAVDGIMLRERPGTIFYQGRFLAESLILAETGNSIGAIQIAGTASAPQLPFFVTACDYTLIGEELFAASAYLSQEPKLIGSIKGQDFGKILFMIAIVLGVILETMSRLAGMDLSLASWFAVQ